MEFAQSTNVILPQILLFIHNFDSCAILLRFCLLKEGRLFMMDAKAIFQGTATPPTKRNYLRLFISCPWGDNVVTCVVFTSHGREKRNEVLQSSGRVHTLRPKVLDSV
jgi:hypothetical protein